MTLRGSTLSADDKKKVLVDSDAAGKGDLSITKVSSAIRLLGAGFFQDVTGVKRTKQKTYDQATLAMEEVDEDVDGAFAAEAENPTEDFVRILRMPHQKSSRPTKTSQLHSIATPMPEKG